MKILNTLQEVWDYCAICPICQSVREVNTYISPSTAFYIDSLIKVESTLNIAGHFKFLHAPPIFRANLSINCLNNSFNWHLSDSFLQEYVSSFDLRMTGDCHHCNCTYCNAEADFDYQTNTISNIRIDRDGYRLLSEPDKFHIVVHYPNNEMGISRICGSGTDLIDLNEVVRLPIIELDFTRIAETINKIKTMIVFS